ncbi:hypothetical protein [Streptomyces sp. NPDC048277]|uniref:hypothetical protein n=1 Tax=Streptomyces sp. NPDC048277 TaxID=3155027 RepID=UPI0033F35246
MGAADGATRGAAPSATGPPVGAAESLGEAGSDDADEAGASGEGAAEDGEASADDDPGFGEEPVAPADDVGRVDADVLGRTAPVSPARGAREEASADGVVPAPATGAATESPSPGDRGDLAGRGESSTLPAGLPSCCPGTGSQGTSEAPDSRVTTMTTA